MAFLLASSHTTPPATTAVHCYRVGPTAVPAESGPGNCEQGHREDRRDWAWVVIWMGDDDSRVAYFRMQEGEPIIGEEQV